MSEPTVPRAAPEVAPNEPGASKTALAVLALRAVHQLVDGEPKVLADPVAAQLLDEATRAGLTTHAAAFAAPAALGLRAHVVARSRFAEDRLQAACARGVAQYVLLGAGFDSFAWRQPDWARGLRIFEVDHPASQQAKRARLAAAGLATPANLTWAPIDFERTSLGDGLSAAGVDLARPIFFSCLGVFVYLPAEAVDELLRFVASRARGTELVFTLSGNFGEHAASQRLADAAAALGEPWRSILTEDEAPQKLRGLGFSDVAVMPAAEIARRYFGGRDDGLAPPRHARIAYALV